MKGKVRNAIIIAAGVLILTVMLTVVLYYYNVPGAHNVLQSA